jgi:ribokinase
VPDVVVVGSCNIDLIAYAPRTPGPGETILGDRFATGVGGKGANQAVMAARLGATVSMIGALGDDGYAGLSIANFAEQGVDASRIARLPGSSGVALIWVEPDGTNRIIVIAGANGRVDPATAAGAVRSLPRLDVIVGQHEIPPAATLAAFVAARGRGATTVLNPAPAAPISPELLAATDWLVPNELEMAALAGRPIASDDRALSALAADAGVRLIVTLGAAGAAVVDGGTVRRIPAPAVTPVDTTAAGDAFVGALAAGLALGLAVDDAARVGIACASDSVTRPGTQVSYPDRARAAALLAAITGP